MYSCVFMLGKLVKYKHSFESNTISFLFILRTRFKQEIAVLSFHYVGTNVVLHLLPIWTILPLIASLIKYFTILGLQVLTIGNL